MDSINENGHSFKFAIIGEHYAPSPALLGRDNPYTLNVKLVDKDGKPVSGVKYKITSTNDGAHLVVTDGMDRTYTSSEAGEDFYIEGLPAKTEADLKNMQYAFSVDCETEGESETVIGRHPLRMGRLLRWGRPGITVKTNPDKAVFSTKTERVAKESTAGAKWNWGEKVNQCKLKLGTSIEGSGATSPTNNNDGSFSAAPEIDLTKFSNVSKATLQFEGGLSDDQFTAVLPSTENDVELYYFQSVAFTKPSVIVGVPAEVTCKLMGLDKKPRANVDVEWTTNFGTLDPAASKTDAQGVAKTKCTANDAGTATVTVLSKAHRTIRGTSAAVGGGPLVIVDPVASATQYIEGHTPAIKFSVTLQAAEQPVSGLTVEWFVGDSPQGTTISDSAGKATRELTFTAGQNTKQLVRARVSDTQVQTTFDVNVYAVVIKRQEPATPEYIIGHTGNIAFSVWLEAAGTAPPGTAVEWFVDGVKEDTSKSDSSGKATQNLGFSRPGDHKVTAKIGHSDLAVDFTVKTYALELSDITASNTKYIIGHSPDVEFSVVVTADGKPIPNVRLEWMNAEGEVLHSGSSDSSGNASFKKGFQSGESGLVQVKGPGPTRVAKINISVGLLTALATWRADNDDANRFVLDPVRYRGLKYILNIKLVDRGGDGIVGVPFTLRAPGHADMGVEIEGLDEEVLSTKNGVDFEWTSSDSSKLEDIKLMVSGQSVQRWESVHPLGWLCEPARAFISGPESVSISWDMVTDLPGRYRIPNMFGTLKPVTVEAFSWGDWEVKVFVQIGLDVVRGELCLAGFELVEEYGILVFGGGSEDGYLRFTNKVLFLQSIK